MVSLKPDTDRSKNGPVYIGKFFFPSFSRFLFHHFVNKEKIKLPKTTATMTAVGRVMRYRLQGRSEGGGSWGARDPPPFGRLFISKVDNIHTIFRWRKGANLKKFQYFGPKDHG